MASLARSIRIDAQPDAAWSAIADFGSVGRWAPAVREAHCTTSATSGVGCTRLVTASNGATVAEVIVAWDEGRLLAFDVPHGIGRALASLRETWSVEPAPGGCEVAVRMEYEPRSGMLAGLLARAVVVPALRRMLGQNLTGLKGFVEGDKAAAAARE